MKKEPIEKRLRAELTMACRYPYVESSPYVSAGDSSGIGQVFWAKLAALGVMRRLCDDAVISEALSQVEPTVRQVILDELTDLIQMAQAYGAEY